MGSVIIEGRNVGKVIGPKGATIRQLQEEFNVRISIARDGNEVSFLFCSIVCEILAKLC